MYIEIDKFALLELISHSNYNILAQIPENLQ